MALPRPSSPRALIADLRSFLAAGGSHRLIAGGLAVLIPGVIFGTLMLQQSHWKPQPKIMRVKMWSADRTDADIIADQKKAQEIKDARAKERQRQFRKLADKLGIE